MNNTKYPEIVKLMQERKESLNTLRKVMGLNYTSQVCRRLSGKVDWTLSDIKNLCKYYNMKFEKLFREEA